MVVVSVTMFSDACVVLNKLDTVDMRVETIPCGVVLSGDVEVITGAGVVVAISVVGSDTHLQHSSGLCSSV